MAGLKWACKVELAIIASAKVKTSRYFGVKNEFGISHPMNWLILVWKWAQVLYSTFNNNRARTLEGVTEIVNFQVEALFFVSFYFPHWCHKTCLWQKDFVSVRSHTTTSTKSRLIHSNLHQLTDSYYSITITTYTLNFPPLTILCSTRSVHEDHASQMCYKIGKGQRFTQM